MTYIMVDKPKFIGFVLITKNLSRDLDNIKDDIQSAGKRLDWEVLASTNIENNLKTITRSMDEQAALLNKMSVFLANALRDYYELDKELFAKWENGNAKVKKSLITDINWLAPLGPSTVAALIRYGDYLKKISQGFDIQRFKDGSIWRSQKFLDALDNDEIKGIARYLSSDEIKSALKEMDDRVLKELKEGGDLEGTEFVNKKAAVLGALRDRLGWLSVGVDVVSDFNENLKKDASTNKIIGDTLGNVVVGAGTAVAGALLVTTLPVSLSFTTVVTAGFGISVGLTYLTEGIKFDFDNDKKDESIKDMVKAGFTNGLETVAGWFK
ncbi:hypothetical protein [Cytobacillus firmus]|uniref:hypothetical protein n=1 Tax=Cytobacillus firmus TaxID=1399 RepID=UPI0021623905|nr:hypothetical protein [Cytobacillus firmus]MCS0674499.1 hypothetical protein [Cytobacillus firmus]